MLSPASLDFALNVDASPGARFAPAPLPPSGARHLGHSFLPYLSNLQREMVANSTDQAREVHAPGIGTRGACFTDFGHRGTGRGRNGQSATYYNQVTLTNEIMFVVRYREQK